MKVDLSGIDVNWINTKEAIIAGCVMAGFSMLLSIIHIIKHLRNYAMPGIQIYVVRILFICPVYALSSALALSLGRNGLYAEIGRDVYEAFVIYSFLNLILEYCGGETDCVYQIENEPPLRLPCPLCFLDPLPRDARLMRYCHRGVLQFIIVKPLVALVAVIMIATGNYFVPAYQYIEMTVYNISYAWALYCMYIFYLATSKIIKKFHPIIKFATVKAIVFATYYQSLAVKASNISPEKAEAWNDLILCIEMVFFAMMLMCAFPVSEFQFGIPDNRFMENVKDVLTVRDVVQDVYHNFMPVYQDYALQRSDKEVPETVRLRTYLAGNLDSVAYEMSHRYRGRNRRLTFNALLRGKSIRARLRGENRYKGCNYDSDLDNSWHSNSSSHSHGSNAYYGMGVVLTAKGIEMRHTTAHPTEDEAMLNSSFHEYNSATPVMSPLVTSELPPDVPDYPTELTPQQRRIREVAEETAKWMRKRAPKPIEDGDAYFQINSSDHDDSRHGILPHHTSVAPPIRRPEPPPSRIVRIPPPQPSPDIDEWSEFVTGAADGDIESRGERFDIAQEIDCKEEIVASSVQVAATREVAMVHSDKPALESDKSDVQAADTECIVEASLQSLEEMRDVTAGASRGDNTSEHTIRASNESNECRDITPQAMLTDDSIDVTELRESSANAEMSDEEKFYFSSRDLQTQFISSHSSDDGMDVPYAASFEEKE